MLWLLFNMGQDRYAFDVKQIVEIIPLAKLKELPRSPDYVSGLLNYRGTPLPVIDLSRLNTGQSSVSAMSTRIIVVQMKGPDRCQRLVGLMAERVVETLKKDRSEFIDPGLNNPDTRYLGDVYTDAAGIVQLVDIDKLIPEKILNLLFHAEQAA